MPCVLVINITVIMFCRTGPSLEGRERANLGDILKFMTGARTIPPRSYPAHRKLRFIFSPQSHPESASCFFRVSLPLRWWQFCGNFDKAVLWSLTHFGQF